MRNCSQTWKQILGFSAIIIILAGCSQSVYVYEGKEKEGSSGTLLEETPSGVQEGVTPKEENKSLVGGQNATPIERKQPGGNSPIAIISSENKNMLANRIKSGLLPGWTLQEADRVNDLSDQVDLLPAARYYIKDGKQLFCDILVYPKEFQNAVIGTKARVISVEYLGTDGAYVYYCYPQHKAKADAIIYLKRALKLSPA